VGSGDADGLLCAKERCLLEDGALMRYDTLNKRVEKEQKLGVRKLVYGVYVAQRSRYENAGYDVKSDAQGSGVGLARISPIRRATAIR